MRAVNTYVSVVFVGGVTALLATVVLASADWQSLLTNRSVLLLCLAVLAAWIPLRYHHAGGIQGFTIEGAVLVGMLFVLPAPVAIALVGISSIVAYGVRNRSLRKFAFNIGQIALWATAAAWVFQAVQPAETVLAWRSVLAAVAAVATVVLVNVTVMTELFRRLEDRTIKEAWSSIPPYHLLVLVGNSVAGLLLGFTISVNTWAAVLAGIVLLAVAFGYRGYARVLEDRQRSSRLQDVTRSLVNVTGNAAGWDQFQDALTAMFRAREAHVITDLPVQPDEAGRVSTSDWDSIATKVWKTKSPAAWGREESEMDAMAVPVMEGDGKVLAGVLVVAGRQGLETWDEADIELLTSISNELAVALENVELFQQVERERARWEAESTKLGDVVNAASDGIAMLSSEGTIETWNEAMVSITGLPADQALGQPWFVVLRVRGSDEEDLLPGGDHIVSRAIDGRRYREPVDLQVLRRDGSWRYLRATFAPVRHEDTHPGGTVMVARDVTAEREVEALKADFVATVSHELRTPLTPLRGFLQTLVAHRHQLDQDQVETIYGSMDSQLGRLERLIADLLVVADLDRGATKLQAEQVNLLEAVTIAVRNEASSDTERVDISGQDDVVVAGDGEAVVRVIRALASNALKHTEDRVEVHAERVESEGVVRVRDHGPGIPPWEQKEIFKRFRRLGDHLTRNQGPGLGLPIAAALAERLGGRVTVESDVGEGSVFSLWLPLARPRVVDSVGSGTQAS